MDRKRRDILAAGAAAAGGLALPASWALAAPGALPSRLRYDPAPFTLGVASGDPTPTAVVIWTRLAPDPLAIRGGLHESQSVSWTVASDERLSRVVARGTATAHPQSGGAIHVDVTGLEPDTPYYYGFATADGKRSAVGRTRTLPTRAGKLRLAVVSCQSISDGRYAAYDRIVEEKPDLIVHLGDYIYEHALNKNWPAQVQVVARDLESYRARYALYRGDPQLRTAHQAVPWTLIWDNHEVSGGDWAHPDAAYRRRRAAAYQAWYEHMPIRAPTGPVDANGGFRIYRHLNLGGLVDLMLLDGRQYRQQPPCSKFWDPIGCENPALDDPQRTLLGTEQKRWLEQTLSASKASWRCIGSPVPMTDVKIGGITAYTVPWQGYRAERRALLRHIADGNMKNVVVLSGDWHRSIVSNIKLDFDDLSAPDIASEFCGTSLTSTGDGFHGGLSTQQSRLYLYSTNLHMRFYESEFNGYFISDVTPDRWRSTYRIVDRADPSAAAHTLAVFEVTNGRPGIEMVSGDGGNPFPRGKA